MRRHNKKLINKITPPIAVVGCELLRRKGRGGGGGGEQVLDWEDGEIWQIRSTNGLLDRSADKQWKWKQSGTRHCKAVRITSRTRVAFAVQKRS
jgi:hypothetical protein